MGNPRGHLRLEFPDGLWKLHLPANHEGSHEEAGGRRLTWRAQITALVFYEVLLSTACSRWFWVDLKAELGHVKGSGTLCCSRLGRKVTISPERG